MVENVPSRRWIGCASLGDAFDSPILSPHPACRLPPPQPGSAWGGGEKGRVAFPWPVGCWEIWVHVSLISLPQIRQQGKL